MFKYTTEKNNLSYILMLTNLALGVGLTIANFDFIFMFIFSIGGLVVYFNKEEINKFNTIEFGKDISLVDFLGKIILFIFILFIMQYTFESYFESNIIPQGFEIIAQLWVVWFMWWLIFKPLIKLSFIEKNIFLNIEK